MTTLPNYTPRVPPYQKQLEALEQGWERKGFGYLLDLGCGKSKTLIDNWVMLHEEHGVDGMLLVAPNGIHTNWTRTDPSWDGQFPVPMDKNPGQFQMHMWEKYLPTLRQYTWRSRGKRALRECEDFIRDQVTPGLQVLAINIEALAAANGVFDLARLFLKQRKCMIVLDESILIKDRRSSRTKLMWQLAKLAPYRRILTGRPSKGSPSDVWAQFQFLEPGCLGHTSFYTFQRQYCKTREIFLGPRRVLTEVGAQNLEELADRLKQHAFRVRKEDCLDLPPKVRLPWCEVPMNEEQTRLYKEMTEQAIVTLDDGSTVSATIALTQIEKLHQIACGHLRLEDGTVRWLSDARLEALLDIISKTREQVVIWCSYRPDQGRVTRALEELYGADRVARWYGDVPIAEREEGEARFKRGEARYLVASQSAGARGRDWTAGTLCVYYSDTHDLELREQSEDRLHRGGQTKSVSYIDMVVRGTIDERILKSHATKISVVDQITRDGALAVLRYNPEAV